jgi:hypothetical protein
MLLTISGGEAVFKKVAFVKFKKPGGYHEDYDEG